MMLVLCLNDLHQDEKETKMEMCKNAKSIDFPIPVGVPTYGNLHSRYGLSFQWLGFHHSALPCIRADYRSALHYSNFCKFAFLQSKISPPD
jgi:hypothetical protein